MSSCNPNKVREMVTHLGTHLFIKDNSNVCIPVISHGFAVSFTILAIKSRSHADYVISHAFQLKKTMKINKLVL